MNLAEEVKSKIDIVDFIRGYLTVTGAGKYFKANCPFHKEKTPSFMISPERQSWYCFGGCNEGGDVIAFLMKYENLEFFEAIKVLAEKAGVDIKNNEKGRAEYRQYGVLYDAVAEAKNFFRKNLTKTIGEYALSRGLTRETILEFELGYAPPQLDELFKYLQTKGFSPDDLERVGLIYKTDRGTYWDRFRNRLMFPIYNGFGKPVGFTGRILELPGGPKAVDRDGNPLAKYVNSKESEVFNKSKLLYGLQAAKNAIRESGEVLLVEGQMDFLMTFQDGVKNVVATSGTALTADHLKSLRRLASKLILAFDADPAGQNAIERAIDLALPEEFESVKVLRIENGKDPADLVKEKSGAVALAVRNAVPVFNFYLEKYLKGAKDKEEERRGLKNFLLKSSKLPSAIEREEWLRGIASVTGFREESLIEEMERLSGKVVKTGSGARGGTPGSSRYTRDDGGVVREGDGNLIDKKLMVFARLLVFYNFDLPKEMREGLGVTYELWSGLVDERLKMLASLENNPPAPDITEIQRKIALKNKEAEMINLYNFLRREILKERFLELKKEMLTSQSSEKLAQILEEVDRLNKELHNVSNEKDLKKSGSEG